VFLWAEGVPGAEMRRKVSVQYGNNVMSQQIAYEWSERFKIGRTSVNHEEGARCLPMSITDANME
jgi:hypothetical protein